jgi:hypothetical protein
MHSCNKVTSDVVCVFVSQALQAVLQLTAPAVHRLLTQPLGSAAAADIATEIDDKVTVISEVSFLLQPLCVDGELAHTCWGCSR